MFTPNGILYCVVLLLNTLLHIHHLVFFSDALFLVKIGHNNKNLDIILLTY